MNLSTHHPVAAMLLLACLSSVGCGGNEPTGEAPSLSTADPPAPEPVAVSLVKAERRSMPRYLRATGDLTADQDSSIAADASGKVLAVPVERGFEVEKGAPLVTLDDRSAKLSLAESEASVALAESRLALADNELTRNEPLVEARAISQTEFQRLKTNRDAARAELAAAEARRDLAAKTVADSVVRAPFSGSVAERLVDPGEYVRAETEVARVVALDRLRLQLTIPETSVGNIRKGQRVAFAVAAWPGEEFAGQVEYIGAAIRVDTRDLLIEAQVDNDDRKLNPGMFAEGRLRLGDVQAVAVPDGAVRVVGTRRSIFLFDEGKAQETLVELGESNDGWVEIVAGIDPGVVVIATPPESLRDGDPVTAGGKE